jgi:hypothetical protein
MPYRRFGVHWEWLLGVALIIVAVTFAFLGPSLGGGGADSGTKAFDRDMIGLALISIRLDLLPGDELAVRKDVDVYLARVRKYIKDLGKSEVKRILARDATDLEPDCGFCADALDRERESLG